MRPVILASGSPRRKELLRALIDAFDVAVSNALEEPVPDDPVAGAIRLALRKARAIAEVHPGAVVIGSDTVVHDGDRDYGKPQDANDAVAMLRALRGREHMVVTAVAVLYEGRELTAESTSWVTLAALPDATIDGYVASGRPLDKAGAYAIQDEDVPTVSRFEGCYCGVMGLPLWALRRLLSEAGVDTSGPSTAIPRCARCPEQP